MNQSCLREFLIVSLNLYVVMPLVPPFGGVRILLVGSVCILTTLPLTLYDLLTFTFTFNDFMLSCCSDLGLYKQLLSFSSSNYIQDA